MNQRFSEAPLEKFTELGYVLGRTDFSRQLFTPDQPIIEATDMWDGFDPSHPGVPRFDEVPGQAQEAVAIMVDDMRATFAAGSYVLRILFRQGDAAQSMDPWYHTYHRDLEGNCLATYSVNDEDPTIALLDGKERFGKPFQVVRLRGDVLHRRPDEVSTHRTTVIANITDQSTFEAAGGGTLAAIARLAGLLKPVQY